MSLFCPFSVTSHHTKPRIIKLKGASAFPEQIFTDEFKSGVAHLFSCCPDRVEQILFDAEQSGYIEILRDMVVISKMEMFGPVVASFYLEKYNCFRR